MDTLKWFVILYLDLQRPMILWGVALETENDLIGDMWILFWLTEGFCPKFMEFFTQGEQFYFSNNDMSGEVEPI